MGHRSSSERDHLQASPRGSREHAGSWHMRNRLDPWGSRERRGLLGHPPRGYGSPDSWPSAAAHSHHVDLPRSRSRVNRVRVVEHGAHALLPAEAAIARPSQFGCLTGTDPAYFRSGQGHSFEPQDRPSTSCTSPAARRARRYPADCTFRRRTRRGRTCVLPPRQPARVVRFAALPLSPKQGRAYGASRLSLLVSEEKIPFRSPPAVLGG